MFYFFKRKNLAYYKVQLEINEFIVSQVSIYTDEYTMINNNCVDCVHKLDFIQFGVYLWSYKQLNMNARAICITTVSQQQ